MRRIAFYGLACPSVLIGAYVVGTYARYFFGF